MNRFELHIQEWKNCKRCNYSQRRKRVVFGKGQLPCDILVIGEAPGESEDVMGVPMVAQVGRLMDRILTKAGVVVANKRGEIWDTPDDDPAVWNYTVSITNMLGCVPKVFNEEENWWEKEEPPDDDCVKICKPRLEEWIDFASPRLIITAGKLAEDWFDQTWKEAVILPVRDDAEGHPTVTPIVHIVHPSSILRKPFVERGVAVQREVAKIRIAIRDYLLPKEEASRARAEAERK